MKDLKTISCRSSDCFFLKELKAFWLWYIFPLFFCFFPACSPKTSTVQIPVDVSEPFSSTGEAEMPSRWWKVFENPQLDELVELALDSNFNLQSAWYRLQAAEAVVDRESSALLPDLEATVQGEINRPQVAFEEIEQNRSLRLGLSSVYELDLWGRIRSMVQAERYFTEAAYAD